MEELPEDTLIQWLKIPTDRRLGALLEAFRRGWSIDEVNKITSVTKWFLNGFKKIIDCENSIESSGKKPSEISREEMADWKSMGSRTHTSLMLWPVSHIRFKSLHEDENEDAVMMRRHQLRVHPKYRMVDSCAAEFAAKTPYYYSTYEPNSDLGVDVVPGISDRTEDTWLQ